MYLMGKAKKTWSVFAACLAMVLCLMAAPGLTAKAAVSYSGSGTMADPYLVQTAEQLQGMRENLSAHYKLANTIDLSGVAFTPIGRLDAPFTGSFVCELNADNTPKYVIKNLKIAVKETPYVAENKSKWEAALFGATNGSTISGIYVLDASISNDNYGDNTGAVAYGNYKPGMDEMPTAVLIGNADATSVLNCGVTGTISARSNGCSGLINRATNCTVENCYSTVNVTTEGLWGCAGFIYVASGCNISNCFATGNVKGNAQTSTFVSVIGEGATATNCYATGKVLGGEISEGFGSAVSTSQLSIPAIGVVTDASKYTPGAVEATTPSDTATGNATTSTDTTTGSTTTSTDTTSDTTTTTTSPDEVKAMIEALPDMESDGIVAEDKDAVKEAWKAYESMSIGDKDAFDATLCAKLMECRYQVSLLIASDWIQDVEALPKTEELTAEDVEKINELWDDYLFLDEKLIAEIDEEIIKKIEAAHEFAEENSQTQGTFVEVETGLTTMEKTVVIVCLIVTIMAIAFDVVAGSLFLRKRKQK